MNRTDMMNTATTMMDMAANNNPPEMDLVANNNPLVINNNLWTN